MGTGTVSAAAAHGDAVTWLMKVRGFSFLDALAYLGATPIEGRPQQPAYVATPTASPTRDAAIRCWTEAVPACGTLVETYLASRGLSLPEDPPIRFHPECQRGPRDAKGTVTFGPAMVCLLVDPVTAKPTGVHRTYLTTAGSKRPRSLGMAASCPASPFSATGAAFVSRHQTKHAAHLASPKAWKTPQRPCPRLGLGAGLGGGLPGQHRKLPGSPVGRHSEYFRR